MQSKERNSDSDPSSGPESDAALDEGAIELDLRQRTGSLSRLSSRTGSVQASQISTMRIAATRAEEEAKMLSRTHKSAAEGLNSLTKQGSHPDPCRGQFVQTNQAAFQDGFRSKTLAMKSRKIQRAPGHAAPASFGSSQIEESVEVDFQHASKSAMSNCPYQANIERKENPASPVSPGVSSDEEAIQSRQAADFDR